MSSNGSNGSVTPPLQTPPATPPNTPANGTGALITSEGLDQVTHRLVSFAEQPKPEFGLFGKFPVEVQHQICKSACPTREIVATENATQQMLLVPGSNGDSVRISVGGSQIIITGARKPNIVLAIPGIAEMLVKTRYYQPLLRVRGSPKVIYFNVDKDILRIETNMVNFNVVPLCILPQQLNNAADCQLIQQITISIKEFLYFEPWAAATFDCFGTLRQVNLIGNAYTGTRGVDEVATMVVEYDVRTFFLGFQSSGGQILTESLLEAKYEVNGVEYRGIGAHAMAFVLMTEDSERRYFLRIADQLESMLAHDINLPLVRVFIKYTI